MVKIYSPQIGLYTDFVQYILPVFFLKPKQWLRVPLGFILDFSFQFISVLVKDLSLYEFISDNLLITLIWCIDYYVMLILYYLYSNELRIRKELKNNGKVMVRSSL